MPASSTHAADCRNLAARARQAALGTIARDPPGHPYVSLVAVAVDEGGRPVLLLSKLAEHTANLAARPEVSLLFQADAREAGDPLALGRATLLGRCAPVPPAEVDSARAAFLVVHPEAAEYAGFTDFAFYRVEPMALRYVGGFGRMSWVDADAYRAAAPR